MRSRIREQLAGLCSLCWDAFTVGVTAVISLCRVVPFLWRERPATPLRILCMAAFDTVSMLRHCRRIRPDRLQDLAVLLDHAACLNRFYDEKGFSQQEYLATKKQLASAGIQQLAEVYRTWLRCLEQQRPAIGAESWEFHQARRYREEVVELSLALLSAQVFERASLDESLASLNREEDMQLLLRIVMQCQVIDDVLDYRTDHFAGLPSFLTTSQTIAQGLAQTRRASRGYRRFAAPVGTDDCCPMQPAGRLLLRTALLGVSALASLSLTYREIQLVVAPWVLVPRSSPAGLPRR